MNGIAAWLLHGCLAQEAALTRPDAGTEPEGVPVLCRTSRRPLGGGAADAAAPVPEPGLDLDPLDRDSARTTWERKVHARMAHHVVLRPLGADRPTLLVVLHGSGGSVQNMALIQEAAAASGYPTVALSWYLDGGGPAAATCGASTTEDALNDCLREERGERFDVIEQELVAVLDELAATFPSEGWERFLDGDGTAVLWPAIALAGYSDGAQQVGFTLRVAGVAPRGALFVSGGGDCGSLERCTPENPRSADWVLCPLTGTDPGRLVGLLHAHEPNAELLHMGWDAVGMTDTRAETSAVSAVDDTVDGFGSAHRLEYGGEGGHTTLLSHDDLFPALMYLIAVAGN